MEKGIIKPSELRIGNLVYDVEDGNYYEIESIYLKDDSNVYWVSYRDGSIKCRVDALEPIVLKEEWLLRMGFEKSDIVECLYNIIFDKFEISITCEGDKVLNIQLSSTNISGAYPNVKHFKYVHSLQNLVHALTNEELTIK